MTYHLIGEAHSLPYVNLCPENDPQTITIYDYLVNLMEQIVKTDSYIDIYLENGINWDKFDLKENYGLPIGSVTSLVSSCLRPYFKWQLNPKKYVKRYYVDFFLETPKLLLLPHWLL